MSTNAKLCNTCGCGINDEKCIICGRPFARTLGVSFATVNRWENGKTKPSRLAQEKIKQVANMGK